MSFFFVNFYTICVVMFYSCNKLRYCVKTVAGGVESYMDDGVGLNGNISTYPYFEFNVPRNVTTAVGQTAFLHCRVEQLGDKAVSTKCIFIRPNDLLVIKSIHQYSLLRSRSLPPITAVVTIYLFV